MPSKNERAGGLVYSTDHGRMCPACGQPAARCACKKKALPDGDGIVRIGRGSKGRKGKEVTVITGLPLDPEGLAQLAKQIKQGLGAGGTVKGGAIEIQGDHRSALLAEMKKRGYQVKLAGG
jgi:translation initiation factor 1